MRPASRKVHVLCWAFALFFGLRGSGTSGWARWGKVGPPGVPNLRVLQRPGTGSVFFVAEDLHCLDCATHTTHAASPHTYFTRKAWKT